LGDLKEVFSAFLLASILVPAAQATVIVVEYDADHVIVAADSRQGGQGRFNDHACKITQLSPRAFFFADGSVTGEIDEITLKPLWSVDTRAKTAWNASKDPSDPYTLVRVAATWGELMRVEFQSRLRSYIRDLAPEERSRQLFVEGMFGGMIGDEVGIYDTLMRFAVPPDAPQPDAYFVIKQVHPGATTILPQRLFGNPLAGSLVAEFLMNETPRAKEANAVFERKMQGPVYPDLEPLRLQAAIEFAIQALPNDVIGGPVDVMVLTKGSPIRWVSRKQECN
jgi:hypothetical protein